jgi:N-acetylglutamate synthase-like GNAT family acetyltransferase
MPFALRVADRHDIPALEALIPLSARELQAAYYSPPQIDGALGTVFAVDRQLISDGTYFVVEDEGIIVGCGGWSKRKTLFGGDEGRHASEDALLDPARESARIRAFFVHPRWARRGIGMLILRECERAATAAGFSTLELVATLAGVPLYVAGGFRSVEEFEIPLANGGRMPAVRMTKAAAGPPDPSGSMPL